MSRRLLNGLIAVSLVVALSLAALLVRTVSYSDVAEFATPAGHSYLVTCRGGVFLFTQPFASPTSWEWDRLQLGNSAEPYQAAQGTRYIFDIRFGSYFTSMKYNAWCVAVPLWTLIILFALPALTRVLWPLARRPKSPAGFPVVQRLDCSP
jgi:hypothetical protein